MAVNHYEGKQLLLEYSSDAGTTWKRVGGIMSKGITRDNPVSDTTSQSTIGVDTESQFAGYGTVTLEGSGVVDTRTSDGSNDLATFKELSALAYGATPEGFFRISDPDEQFEGEFNITSLQKNAEQTALVNFSISLQNKGTVTYTAL